MPPMGIVPGLDEPEHRPAGLALRPEGPPPNEFAFQRRKEALAQRVVDCPGMQAVMSRRAMFDGSASHILSTRSTATSSRPTTW